MDLTQSGARSVGNLVAALQEAAPENTYPRFVVSSVTTVEAHIDTLLKHMITQTGLETSTFGSALLDKYANEFTRKWSDRFYWLDRGFGVTVNGTTAAQDMQVAVELRNAIVHGDMRLTDLQTDGISEMVQLKQRLRTALNVECVGRRIYFNSDTVERTIKSCITFIQAFDQKLLVTYPRLDV